MQQRHHVGQRPLPSLARYGRPRSLDGFGLAGNPANRVDTNASKPTIKSYISSNIPPEPKVEPSAPVFKLSLEPVSAGAMSLSISAISPWRLGRRVFVSWSLSYLLYALAAALFIAGMYVVIDGWNLNQRVTEQAGTLSAQSTVQPETASSDQPTGSAQLAGADTPVKCSGKGDVPNTLTVASVGLRACVTPVGVGDGNQLEAPKNIHTAGWYNGSAKLGDSTGAMLIDGHSGTLEGQGVGAFAGLYHLKQGAEIQVENGDGAKATFVVKSVKTVKAQDVNMGEVLRSAEPGKLGLNLITCAGDYDESSGFDSRIVVLAVQKG